MSFYIPWLVDAARLAVAGTGKQVIVSEGWQSRGHGPMRLVEIVVGHHTGTSDRAPGDYPSLPIVRDGRADLAGPLSNYGLGRSGNIYVIAAGCCWHAGASAYGGYTDLNDEAIGIEAESAGGGGWTHDQGVMYPRLVGACFLYMRRGVDHYASHRTVARPAGRKPDPTGLADNWMRDMAAEFMRSPASAPTPAPAPLEEVKPKEEEDEMSKTIYVVGDNPKFKDVYCLTADAEAVARRKITVPEYQIMKAAGIEPIKVPQDALDAITVTGSQ